MTGLRVAVVLIVGAACVAAPAAAKDRSDVPPPPAAVGELQVEVNNLVADSGRDFGFTLPVGSIEVGTLRPSYMATRALGRDGAVTSQRDGVVFAEEWVAPVYQNGIPINVVGMWEPSPGTFEMSTFGYGQDLAESLDVVPAGQMVLHEAPFDAWYAVGGDRIRIIRPGEVVGQDLGDVMSWTEFADAYRERLAAMVPDGTMSSEPSAALWIVALGVLALGALLLGVRRAPRRGSTDQQEVLGVAVPEVRYQRKWN